MSVPFARKVKVRSRNLGYDDETGLGSESDGAVREIMAAVQPLSTYEATEYRAMEGGISKSSMYKLYSMEVMSENDVVSFSLGALWVSAQIVSVMPYFSEGNACEHYKYIAKGA